MSLYELNHKELVALCTRQQNEIYELTNELNNLEIKLCNTEKDLIKICTINYDDVIIAVNPEQYSENFHNYYKPLIHTSRFTLFHKPVAYWPIYIGLILGSLICLIGFLTIKCGL
jgi:hypothetical protein